MNIVLLLAHAVEEYDQVKLLSGLGYNVFSIGAYSNPGNPSVDIRPPLPETTEFPILLEACHAKRIEHERDVTIDTPEGPRNPIDWAKADLPDEVVNWADVIICHHVEHTWLVPQWNRIKHKRVIWRTVGQSVENNERVMAPLRTEGMQIVRYSPKERNIPGYLGEDALIRFYKDPEEWNGWTGEQARVVNFTQHLRQRHPYTNWEFWERATRDLPANACGPGSEVIGGSGESSLGEMKHVLRTSRAYLYTGTQPASYTLGLIEAMMTGIPVMSIGPAWMNVFPYGPELFEGHEITGDAWSNNPRDIHRGLQLLLRDWEFAKGISEAQRDYAVHLFGKDRIGQEWKTFLG